MYPKVKTSRDKFYEQKNWRKRKKRINWKKYGEKRREKRRDRHHHRGMKKRKNSGRWSLTQHQRNPLAPVTTECTRLTHKSAVYVEYKPWRFGGHWNCSKRHGEDYEGCRQLDKGLWKQIRTSRPVPRGYKSSAFPCSDSRAVIRRNEKLPTGHQTSRIGTWTV